MRRTGRGIARGHTVGAFSALMFWGCASSGEMYPFQGLLAPGDSQQAAQPVSILLNAKMDRPEACSPNP